MKCDIDNVVCVPMEEQRDRELSPLSHPAAQRRRRGMRILVIGGSGVIGRPTTAELIRRGHSVAVLSRRGGGGPPGAKAFSGDLTTGTGLDRALTGVDCVIDCANYATTSRRAATTYFTDTTRRLGRLGLAAGVEHHVVLSIVSLEDVPYGYYQGKLTQTSIAGAVKQRLVWARRMP